jgi:hypothetical protein
MGFITELIKVFGLVVSWEELKTLAVWQYRENLHISLHSAYIYVLFSSAMCGRKLQARLVAPTCSRDQFRTDFSGPSFLK